MDGCIELVFGVWTVDSFQHILHCFKEIRVSAKIRVLPSGTLSKTPDLENFASAYRSSKRYQFSWRKVDAVSMINWTVVGQLS